MIVLFAYVIIKIPKLPNSHAAIFSVKFVWVIMRQMLFAHLQM